MHRCECFYLGGYSLHSSCVLEDTDSVNCCSPGYSIHVKGIHLLIALNKVGQISHWPGNWVFKVWW